jgi:hypothetical protein
MATPRICSIPDCGKGIFARCLCAAHYTKLLRHGDPLKGRARRKVISECSVDGCIARGGRRGLCVKHYARWKRHGDPLVITMAPAGSHIEWLYQHVAYQMDDCLQWPFPRSTKDGRGYTDFRGSRIGAHRAMCFLAHGDPSVPSLEAAHSCGKGHEGCVNPRHLRWATTRENEADKIEHGTRLRGMSIGNAKLTADDISAIRSLCGTMRQSEIAALYGVKQTTISAIKRRQIWAWLD